MRVFRSLGFYLRLFRVFEVLCSLGELPKLSITGRITKILKLGELPKFSNWEVTKTSIKSQRPPKPSKIKFKLGRLPKPSKGFQRIRQTVA